MGYAEWYEWQLLDEQRGKSDFDDGIRMTKAELDACKKRMADAKRKYEKETGKSLAEERKKLIEDTWEYGRKTGKPLSEKQKKMIKKLY